MEKMDTMNTALRYPDGDHALEVGVDEAGRGSLALDVFASAVLLPPTYTEEHVPMLTRIRDSKSLSPAVLQELAGFIEGFSIAWAVGSASPHEIDDLNILNATHLAMHRALQGVEKNHAPGFSCIAVDGDRFKPYLSIREDQDWVAHTCVRNGDATLVHIAAASILAKTHRDTTVAELCQREPELNSRYGFLANKAYGTLKHRLGLVQYGPVPGCHRYSYSPVKKVAVIR